MRVLRIALAATLLAVAARPSSAQGPVKVVIDADPGIDDSMAILFALSSPALDVVGITTVFGNATLEQGTRNALRLVELSGSDVPVVAGASEPLVLPRRPPPDFVHGTDGIGNVNAPPPTGRSVRTMSKASGPLPLLVTWWPKTTWDPTVPKSEVGISKSFGCPT